MNILIIGLGSIGQRHLRNIKKIYNKKVNFFALRKKFKTPTLSNKNKPIKKKIEDIFNIKLIKNLEDIKNYKLNLKAAFICSPTSLHIDQLIWLVKNDINVFIEKPISDNLKKISLLKKLIKKTKSITMMGYQYRFDPIVNFLKNEKKIFNLIGKLNFIGIDHGEDLRSFHSWEKYENSYTSIKKLGGGVTLCQIHEFEYFLNIFQKYKILKSKSIIEKVSNFKIDVDDTSSHLFLLKKNNQKIICNLNLNFYEIPKNRTIKLIGQKGKIVADLNKKYIKILNKKKTKKINFKYARNDLFLREIKYFFKLIKNKNRNNEINANWGIKNLEFVSKLIND